jgi:hypothetical protein
VNGGEEGGREGSTAELHILKNNLKQSQQQSQKQSQIKGKGEQNRVAERLNILALRKGHFGAVDFLDRSLRHSVHLELGFRV